MIFRFNIQKKLKLNSRGKISKYISFEFGKIRANIEAVITYLDIQTFCKTVDPGGKCDE